MGDKHEVVLEVRSLKKHYPIERGLLRRNIGMVKAVDGVDFTIEAGETLGLVGESGCGKTTTGRCILRAIEPSSGQVFLQVNGSMVEITALNKRELYGIRPHAQMIFQDPYSSLDPRMTVMNIIAEPLVANKLARGSELIDRVVELMKLVGLESAHLKRYPHAFSGGQRQRIGIARALAPNPRLVVADEAVSALDVSVRAQILNLLEDLQDSMNLTYLFVAHDLSVVEHISDRVAVMYVGRMVELAETEELFVNPLHPYTEALLSAVPRPDPDTRMDRIILPGEVANPSSPPTGCYFHPRCRYARDVCSHETPAWTEVSKGHWASCHFARELKLRGVLTLTKGYDARNAGPGTRPAVAGSSAVSRLAPVFFERNRVGRVYTGGMLFHGFFGDEPRDDYRPEEWIASTVRALNRDGKNPLEGVSLLEGSRTPFTEYLGEHPEALGGRADLGILVKVLDSAVRLPVQTHPDKSFSRKHFKSNHGKTEMWIVLATREDARVYFGFKRSIRRPEFVEAIEASMEDRHVLTSLLNSVPVKPGDIYFIPPRVVHAIGAGCLILEIQEPTDFTLQPEMWCADYKLNDYERFLGLDATTALDCFDFDDVVGEKAILRGRINPRTVGVDRGLTIESIVSLDEVGDFGVNRYTVSKDTFLVPSGPSVWVVIDGQGHLRTGGTERGLSTGDYFFMPANADAAMVSTSTSICIVESFPPST